MRVQEGWLDYDQTIPDMREDGRTEFEERVMKAYDAVEATRIDETLLLVYVDLSGFETRADAVRQLARDMVTVGKQRMEAWAEVKELKDLVAQLQKERDAALGDEGYDYLRERDEARAELAKMRGANSDGQLHAAGVGDQSRDQEAES